MSDNTKIEWCDSTFNPWIGCTKVSPECDNCYAEADFDLRKHRVKWGTGNQRSRTSPENWKKPLQWDRKHDEFFAVNGLRRRVFCASLADVFDNEVPAAWRHDLFNLIHDTPNLDWLLLTKRPQNIIRMVNESGCVAGNGTRYLPGNVWLGASAGDQNRVDMNVPPLLRAKEATGARFAFLSIEPLLGPVVLPECTGNYRCKMNGIDGHSERPLGGLDWIVVGGESGQHARPMHPDWVRALRDQCAAAGVPFLFKQWGEWVPHGPIPGGDEARDLRNGIVQYMIGDGREFDGHFRRGDAAVRRVGKKAAGRLLDGVQHDGYPKGGA